MWDVLWQALVALPFVAVIAAIALDPIVEELSERRARRAARSAPARQPARVAARPASPETARIPVGV